MVLNSIIEALCFGHASKPRIFEACEKSRCRQFISNSKLCESDQQVSQLRALGLAHQVWCYITHVLVGYDSLISGVQISWDLDVECECAFSDNQNINIKCTEY